MRAMQAIGWALVAASPLSAQATYSPTISSSDLQAAAAQNLAIMAATTQQFAGGSSAFQTKEALIAAYPCSAAILGQLGNVTNLYGSYARTLKCQTDAISGNYYWYPDNPDGAVSVAMASGTYTVSTLGTPPTIYLPTTPTGTVNVSFTTPCVPGETKHIYAPSSLGLGSVNLGGLIGSGTVPLAQGSDKIVTCIGGTGWKSN